ncbi:hypothetical protein [Frisingicoccus sp.]|uniref:phosphoribosyltransferase-like protein n=1 Tax=Frisingicoccus sp. TaxID=1918627 RepID=UPI003AB54F6E
MMIKQFEKLEESIADKIKDYQKDLNHWTFDDKHVDTWVNQFPEDERLVVLTETNSLLKNNYFKKQAIETFFDDIWQIEDIMGADPEKYISHIQFLNIQRKGKSQKRLLRLIEEYYLREKHTQINKINHAGVKKYIYLDDCMYTGFTLLKDIKNWIDTMNPNENTELEIIFLGLYSGNHQYIKKCLDEKCAEKNISVIFTYAHRYNNKFYKYPLDILWPQKVENDEYVDAYLNVMEEQKVRLKKGGLGFRKEPIYRGESRLFTGTENRVLFEKALLKRGAYICSLPANGNDRMKPMGYDTGISLGFGAFFVTDYNISNNCPLAFWWGNLNYSSDTTLGKWYPLLPREANYNG